MQKNNKSIIIGVAAVLVAAFFMPWIKIFGSFSAWDIVFGDIGQYVDTPFRYAAALIPIAGILIIYGAAFNNENYPVPKTLLFILPILTLIVLAIVIGDKLGGGGGNMRSSDFDGIMQIIGIGFWLTLIGSIILPFLNQQQVKKTASTPIVDNQTDRPIQSESINENSNTSQSVSQPTYVRPQVNINLPKVDWDKTFGKIKSFFIRYRVILISGAGVLIAFLFVYNFFIKADPVKDGKNLARNYCACTEELDKSNLVTTESFLNDFDNIKYKSRIEARTALNNLMQTNQAKYSSCTQQADIKYKEKYADYNGNGGRNVQIFEQTYNSLIGSCGSNINTDLMSIQNKIDTKINTIIDPEPDIEKIKADLIGNNMLGWNFDALAEFDKATISNSSRAADRIEFTMDLHLIGVTAKDLHDAQIIVNYKQDESGWLFDGVKAIYITYTYSLQTDNWLTVTILNNSTYTILNNGQKYWIQEGSYGQKYKGGGTDGEQFYLNSSQINLASREDHPIELTIKYVPN